MGIERDLEGERRCREGFLVDEGDEICWCVVYIGSGVGEMQDW